MSQNEPHSPNINDKELIDSFFKREKDKIELERAQLKLEEKRIDSNERLALKSMEYQARDNKSHPGQQRKTMALIGVGVILTLLILSVFCFYLLQNGHKDLVYSLGKGLSYVLVAGVFYLAGKKKRPKREDDDSEFTDFVEE